MNKEVVVFGGYLFGAVGIFSGGKYTLKSRTATTGL
jgi:hypothetical protein